MKNKNTLQIRESSSDEKQLMNTESVTDFIYGADADYFLARVLILTGMIDSGMYHYQQCIEKYLKAFLIKNSIKYNIRMGNGHNLVYLASLCFDVDDFFRDADFLEICTNVTPFEVSGRYPQNKMRSYSLIVPDLLYSLDECVFEIRKRAAIKNVRDLIVVVGEFGKMNFIKDQTLVENMKELFFKDNSFIKENNIQ